jgi:hypothetical protein
MFAAQFQKVAQLFIIDSKACRYKGCGCHMSFSHLERDVYAHVAYTAAHVWGPVITCTTAVSEGRLLV